VSTALVTDRGWTPTGLDVDVLGRAGTSVVEAATGDAPELVELVRDADAVLTCFRRVGEDVVEAGERLKVICRYGVGVDNIAVAAATRRGIIVANVPNYCTDEVAEHVIGLLHALARRLCSHDRAIRSGIWSTSAAGPVHRIAGKTLGIVGFGQIGRAVAARARGLGLQVIVNARRPAPGDAVRHVSLPELFAEADFVTLHLPLLPETQALVGESLLRSMKPTSFLVNTARAGIIEPGALERALAEGWIAGAALDVFEREPLRTDDPLLALDAVVATPHTAFYSEEAVRELEVRAAGSVAAVLAGLRPESVVNPEVLRLERWREMR
jgi:D-3-phosphoglycerate dehydrogenase / 2-oxoglutarate reductase